MKLLRARIEAFGCLREYELTFDPAMTVLCLPNGAGKTTLAAFLRVMLYGLPRANKSDLDKDLRRRYAPWQGGRFGGLIEFETGGRAYRAERFFGDTPRQDTFALYRLDPLRESRDFDEELGLALFGLDAASFERSAYLPQSREAPQLATAAIRQRLTGLVEDDGMGRYEQAMEALRKARARLVPYRGAGGELKALQDRLTRAQVALDEARRQEALIPELSAQRDALEARARALRAAQDACAREETQRALAAHREALLKAQREAARALSELLARYPQGLPDAQALQAAQREADAALRLSETEAPSQEAERLRFLRGFFAPGVPDAEALRQAQAWRGEAHMHAEAARQCAPMETPETAHLRALFSAPPEIAQTTRAERLLPRLTALARGLSAAGLALLLSAAALYFLRLPFLPAVAAALVTLGAGGATLLFRRRLRGRANAELRRYGVDTLEALAALDARWRTLCMQMEDARTRQQQEEAAAAAARASLDGFLNAYFPAGAPEDALSLLQSRAEELSRLEAAEAARRERARERAAHEQAARAFLAKVGEGEAVSMRAALDRVSEACAQYAVLRESAALAQRQLAAFDAEHGELPPPAEGAEPPAQRRERLAREDEETQRMLAACEQRLNAAIEGAGALPDLASALDALRQEISEGETRARMLDETMRCLALAHESLSERYVGRLRARFEEYLAQSGAALGAAHIDPQLEVRFDQAGAARPLAQMSFGLVDLSYLCMRLALADALFEGEQPFLLLDDPLANLDETHTRAALRLLRAQSRARQIVYLVCHPSRTPE